MYNIYIAAPVVGTDGSQKEKINHVAVYAEHRLYSKMGDACRVYRPWRLKVPNAWNMPPNEWARCVFTQDVLELDKADIVIVCDFGRQATAGTAWEAGYAFAKDKRVIHIIMPDVTETSLMVQNGCTISLSYREFLKGDWTWPDFRNQTSEVTQN